MSNKIVDPVYAAAERYPTHIAYDFMGNRVTYAKLVRQIDEAAGALSALGVTEGVVAATLNPVQRQKEGSIGTALPGVQVKIVAPGTEDELPVGEVGEIVFTSATNMTGYYRNAEETEQTLRLHTDGLRWIHSGDLGYADADGYFFFKGRIKRMIVKNGYNIYPNELENIIEGFPMVERCCIVDVPDSSGSQMIRAFLVLKNGCSDSDGTSDQIMALCRRSIARYALPKELIFLPELPKTKVGKVDFAALTKYNE